MLGYMYRVRGLRIAIEGIEKEAEEVEREEREQTRSSRVPLPQQRMKDETKVLPYRVRREMLIICSSRRRGSRLQPKGGWRWDEADVWECSVRFRDDRRLMRYADWLSPPHRHSPMSDMETTLRAGIILADIRTRDQISGS